MATLPPVVHPIDDGSSNRPAHVLRPHHIAILSIFILVFRDPPSPTFHLHIWRILSREIAEIHPPKTYEELIKAVTSCSSDLPDETVRMAQALRNVPKHLNTHHGLSVFFTDLIAFVPDRDYEASQVASNQQHTVERKSYFGLFIRRCYTNFFKLSWRGAIKLLEDYRAWVQGQDTGYVIQEIDRDRGLFILPTPTDEVQHPRTEYYETFDEAFKLGDTQTAIEGLRRFFDQEFSDAEEIGITQHALLNLARLHYSVGEVAAAGNALEEAMKIARTANDVITVHHCTNLLKRLLPAAEAAKNGGKPTPIKPNTSAIEVLWEVKKMVDVGEPLRAAFRKLYQSMGCADAQYAEPEESRWERHAVQATLWSFAGVESLAQTHEGLIIAFTEPSDHEARFSALRSRAKRLIRQGNCGGGLMVLLDPNTWRHLNLRQYGIWANDIWKALHVTARRRDQQALVTSFLIPRKPSEPVALQQYATSSDFPTKLSANNSTKTAKMMIDVRQFADAITPTLDALWNAEYKGTWAYHRIAVAQLAEISIEFGLASRGRKMIEGSLPQVLNGDDLEIRAYTCFTLARCIIAESWSNDDPMKRPSVRKQNAALEEALPFLHVAERDYATIESYRERLHVIYTLSVVYHNLSEGFSTLATSAPQDMAAGVEKALPLSAAERSTAKQKAKEMTAERDRMAELYVEIDKTRKDAAKMVMDEELKEVLDTVIKVAAVIGRQK